MNSRSYQQSDMVIDLKEVIWDLLEQWKAVLIAALLMTVLVIGAKYAKDMKGYNAALAEKKSEVQSTATVEEQIEDILQALPEEERATVLTVVNQNKWIEDQKEYINNSILINTNPTNQRTLCLDYYINAEEDDETVGSSIIKGYATYLESDKVVKSVGDAIDPEISSDYISELISAGVNADTSSAEASDSIFEVQVVLPDEADADKVEKVLTGEIMQISSEISKDIRPHRISLVYAGEKFLYNDYAVNKHTNILYSIYNLQNNTKNLQTSFSEGQKSAIEKISALEKDAEQGDLSAEASEETSSDTAPNKPGFSKKYALLGFVFGAMLYAFIYLLYVILKGCMRSAGDSEYYTQSRLLGEVYGTKHVKGIHKLLHSRFVEKKRYRGRDNAVEQIGRAIEALTSVCEREKANSIEVIDFTGNNKELIDEIVKGASKKEISLDVIDASTGLDENKLLGAGNVALITGPSVKTKHLTGSMALFVDYGVKLLGSIFMDPDAIS